MDTPGTTLGARGHTRDHAQGLWTRPGPRSGHVDMPAITVGACDTPGTMLRACGHARNHARGVWTCQGPCLGRVTHQGPRSGHMDMPWPGQEWQEPCPRGARAPHMPVSTCRSASCAFRMSSCSSWRPWPPVLSSLINSGQASLAEQKASLLLLPDSSLLFPLM